ncbi:MAG: site-specific DNA-methyltransferase [Gammaproteobacteria bacterium AqS3]|nr:site-specific DNA-methyltransferase [Gammaproteobacteria bacterium AqS3]
MDQESPLQKFLARLRVEFPEAIAETQKTDRQGNARTLYALKQEFLDELKGAGLDAANDDNRYELQFPGKRQARLQAQVPCYKTLKAEPEQSVDFEATGNVFIEGDNIDALHLLQKSYRGKVKMIYIDPPYNTGGDGFDYSDDFSQVQQDYLKAIGVLDENGARQISETNSRLKGRFHAGWLAMMYPRLRLARELLRDDGSIFISIDDNEQANLKLLCDEIFGEDNFQYCLSVVNSLNGNDNSSGMMETQDYCLIYSKNHQEFQMGVLAVEEEDVQREWQQDEKGYWKKGGSLKATGINAPRSARPKLFFPIYINEQDLSFSLEKTDRHTYKLLPITDGKEMCWYWSRDKFVQDCDEVIVARVNNGYALYKKQRPSLGDRPSKRGKTTFYSPSYSNTHSNQTIHKLFGRRVFSYSKPIALLQDLIRLADCSGEIVMDFFAGSASTGHAVMQLNAEDGGGRKFVLVQRPEELDKKKSKEAFEFCTSSFLPPPPARPSPTFPKSVCAGRVRQFPNNTP